MKDGFMDYSLFNDDYKLIYNPEENTPWIYPPIYRYRRTCRKPFILSIDNYDEYFRSVELNQLLVILDLNKFIEGYTHFWRRSDRRIRVGIELMKKAIKELNPKYIYRCSDKDTEFLRKFKVEYDIGSKVSNISLIQDCLNANRFLGSTAYKAKLLGKYDCVALKSYDGRTNYIWNYFIKNEDLKKVIEGMYESNCRKCCSCCGGQNEIW